MKSRIEESVIFIIASILVAVAWQLSPGAVAAPVPEFPLPVDQARSTTARQLAKPVLESRLLDDMESTARWRVFGPGEMQLTTDRSQAGQKSIRLTSPTKGAERPRVQGRPFGESGLRFEVPQEDWSAFNRISVWVYPDLPGFNVVSLLMKLQSEGTTGRSYTDGGMNFVLLKNHEWNQVAWEIAHLDRKQVRAVELIYRLQGNEPGAADRVRFDFDKLELQSVEPEHFRGWDVAPGAIAYSHEGYAPLASKVALVAAGTGSVFQVIDVSSGKVVWERQVREVENDGVRYQLLDFTSLRKQGHFCLTIGDVRSQPFRIGEDPFRETLIAGLNFFHCERCGYAVKGIHAVCHQDWRVEHNGSTRPINGGWHDAGDLSQGLVNTSEAIWSMLRLAGRLDKSDSALADRLRQEARWGAEWLLKTRFGDGFRVTWATMDFWTDGVPGNVDDVTVRAGNGPFENFLAAAAEAVAARGFTQSDGDFAVSCRAAAEEDFEFARSNLRRLNLETVAAAAQASVELYRLTRKPEYMDAARGFADTILSCQETQKPDWDRPLSGFFYTSPRRDRIQTYNHRSHEQAPIVVLADLVSVAPGDAKADSWRVALQRYGTYLLDASHLTEPYRLIPAGIYRLADTSDESQKQQIREGIRLTDGVYLRRFPVWGDFRGNLGVLLSQAAAAAAAGRALGSTQLRELAAAQLEWTLGRNPFCQSLMYGVGNNYAPQYTAMSGDIVGSLPVGIQSRLHEDVPYWPTSNCYNYAEVWVHPVSRWFGTLAELGP